jgi:hypothetical protein
MTGPMDTFFPLGLWVEPVNGFANQFPGGFFKLVRTSDRVARTRMCSYRAIDFPRFNLNHRT